VLQSIIAFQERLNQARGQATGRAGRQHAEERPASRNPGKLALQDLRAQATGDQIADRQSGESAILFEIGAEHRPSAADTCVAQRLLQPRGRQMDDGSRVAEERKRRPHALQRLWLISDGEVTGLPARRRAQPRQVSG
jgi:hypothetical protein